MTHIPNDVRKSLENSGVKFDQDGNIIEDDFFDNQENDLEDQQDDDLDDDNQQDDDDLDDEDDQQDNDDLEDDEDQQDDDDLEDDTPKKKKKPSPSWKNNLTPKSNISNDSTETSEILKRIEAIQQQIQNNTQQDDDLDDQQDDPNQKLLSKLQEEARNFEKMAMRRLASELSREVNRRFEKYGVNYNNVINSQEWDDFLNTKVYGESIGKRYQIAIKNQDIDTMVNVFDDFGDRYLKEKEKEKKEKKKSLSDLAVPESSKAKRSVKRRAKYDFAQSDYSEKLNLMERGKITPEEFYSFEAKFEKAEREGRVKD